MNVCCDYGVLKCVRMRVPSRSVEQGRGIQQGWMEIRAARAVFSESQRLKGELKYTPGSALTESREVSGVGSDLYSVPLLCGGK